MSQKFKVIAALSDFLCFLETMDGQASRLEVLGEFTLMAEKIVNALFKE